MRFGKVQGSLQQAGWAGGVRQEGGSDPWVTPSETCLLTAVFQATLCDHLLVMKSM